MSPSGSGIVKQSSESLAINAFAKIMAVVEDLEAGAKQMMVHGSIPSTRFRS